MPNVETEQIARLAAGATPVQIIILVLLGIVAAGLWFAIVKWYVDATNKPRDQKLEMFGKTIASIAADIKTINENLNKNFAAITKVESKLWNEEKVTTAIRGALLEHQIDCDAWKYHCDEHPIAKQYKNQKGDNK